MVNCGGKLVVTFQTDEEGRSGSTAIKMLMGGPGAWVENVVIGPEHSSWAGLMPLDDANVLVMFDHGGCKSIQAAVN